MPSWDGRTYGCHACDVGRAGSARSRGDLPHALSADDALGPVLDAYHQRQHRGKTRFVGILAMAHELPTVRRLLHRRHFDTVLAYDNLLKRPVHTRWVSSWTVLSAPCRRRRWCFA
jgi:hypothetical protein